MVRLCRYLLAVAVLLGGISLCSAETAEDRAFTKAAEKFRLELWDSAAQDFAQFVKDFHTSFRVPDAILFQAEALIKSGRFTSAAQLLTANQSRAADRGDLFLYWTAQAHLGNTNYSAAAETFGRLLHDFSESTNCLAAAVSQGAAYAKLAEWTRVVEVLGRPDGVFQKSAATLTNDLVARGFLLLGEAELNRGNFSEATQAVAALDRIGLKPELAWQKWNLQARTELAQGRLEDARASSTNLFALADAAGSLRYRAESRVLLANILERTNQLAAAISVHEQNLSTNAPAEQQRTALLKIAELSLALREPGEAVKKLEAYWNNYPNAPAADLVLLTLGELQLKQATSRATVDTNLLSNALVRFDLLLTSFPNSSLVGKGLLGKGWCLWYFLDLPGAESVFSAALAKLPFSEDQAVARFKLADAQFTAGNFEAAVRNYQQLVESYATHAEVRQTLIEQALYQTVRAALAVTNVPVASEAVHKMLEWYPNGLMGDRCLFLVAEGFAQKNEPAKARELLREFEERFGAETNSLLPQVRLAVSRAFEREGSWTSAITNYDAWIVTFPGHVQMPEAKFGRAWDTAMAGNETAATNLFNAFVQEFPDHELAARAKWWIADYHFRQGNYGKAEENYPYTTNYARSELFFHAHLRAGAAAMARSSYKDAISYFTNLIGNPRCPNDLKLKAAMAAGDAYMARNEPGASNRVSDLDEASSYFKYVLKTFPASPQVPLAWGRLGDCYKELGAVNAKHFDDALEAYGKVIALPTASTGAKRQALIGMGIVAEARAEGKSAGEKQASLRAALSHYADAFLIEPVHAGEADDVFWYQKAGLETAHTAERLGEWSKAMNIYGELQRAPNISPAFQATLQRRLDRARENLNAAKL